MPSHMSVGEIWQLGRTTVLEWLEDKAARLGAALAYYAVLSLAPFVVLAVGIAGIVYGDGAVGAIQAQFESLVGPEAGRAIAEMATRGDGVKLSALMGLLDDPHPCIRYWAATGCLILKDKAGPATAMLRQMARSDPSPDVRITAAEALVEIVRRQRRLSRKPQTFKRAA